MLKIAAVIILTFAGAANAETGLASAGAIGARTFAAVPPASVPGPASGFAEPGGAKLDTTGCSVQERREQKGPVVVSGMPVPNRSCWNLSSGGLLVEYKWFQSDGPVPQKNNVGMWLSLNSAAQYRKAAYYKCERAAQAGYGHDTGGNDTYVCTAYASFQFGNYPELLRFAYAPSGARNAWDVQVGVSLDDNGAWDSLSGDNYRFRF